MSVDLMEIKRSAPIKELNALLFVTAVLRAGTGRLPRRRGESEDGMQFFGGLDPGEHQDCRRHQQTAPVEQGEQLAVRLPAREVQQEME